MNDFNMVLSSARKGQGSPEFSVVISFVLLIFIIIMFISFERQDEAYRLQVFLDAKKTATSVADNINMISKNGHGYYRYFSIPETLHGFTDYDINIAQNYLDINYSDQVWSTTLITQNVTILHLNKGEYKTNCVTNDNGQVVINDICGFSDQGCGSVQNCDPGDIDNCASCDTPDPVEIYQNSLSICPSYGCSTEEWHVYKLIPIESGNLELIFRGTGTMTGSVKTDLIFYDYTAKGCSSPERVFDLETQTSHTFSVQAGKTYIIGLDVDSTNCSDGGSYWLSTELK